MFDACVFTCLSDFKHQLDNFAAVSQMVVDGIDSVIELGEGVYDVLKSLHAGCVGRVLNLSQEYENHPYDSIMEDIPNCALKLFLSSEIGGDVAAMKMISLARMTKCFTNPVIDIDSSVQNVIGKFSIFNARRKGGEISLWYFRNIF